MLNKVLNTLLLTIMMGSMVMYADEKKDDKNTTTVEKPVVHEEITVKAKPITDGTKVNRYGAKVDVVSAEQIDDMNASDLATAIYKVPGVTISRHNLIGAFGGGEGGAIFLRGHGSSRPGQEIGTMIDGIPRFSGIWTHSLLDMLPVDIAGKIEIYKSTQPVLFGNMSFGAVNIVPKTMTADGSRMAFDVQYGSYQTQAYNAEYGYKNGDFSLFFLGAFRRSDGHRDNADGEVANFYGSINYDISNSLRLSFQLDYGSSDVNDPGEEGETQPMIENFSTESALYILKLEHNSEKADGAVRFYFDDGLQDWYEWDSSALLPYNGTTDYENYGIKAHEAFYFFEGNEILVGFDWDSYGGIYKDVYFGVIEALTDIRNNNIGPYMALSQTFGGEDFAVTFSGGVRFNFNDYYDDKTGYQFGMKTDLKELTIYANFAHSFNLPGLFAAVLFGGGPGGEQWKTLESETNDHWEIGLKWEASPHLSFDVSYFNDDVQNALRVTFPGPKYANTGDYQSTGVEAAIYAGLFDIIDIYFGGCYQDTTPDDTPFAPEFSFTSGLNFYPVDNLNFNFILQYSDEFTSGNPRTPAANILIDAYTLANLRVGYNFGEVFSGVRFTELFLYIENCFDTEYELKPGYPMPGINAHFGIKFKL